MINLKVIKELVETYYDIEDISVKSRQQNYVDARTVFTVLARSLTDYSYTIIGDYINRHHTSITHHINVIHNQWKKSKYHYRRQLGVIDTIYKQLSNDAEEQEEEKPFEVIIQSLKSKIILKEKEIKELYRLLEIKDEKIKELNKYKPVW
jgi:uncharacterized protein HemX